MLTEKDFKFVCKDYGWEFVEIENSYSIVKIKNKIVKIPIEAFQVLFDQLTYIKDFESSEEGYEQYYCGC